MNIGVFEPYYKQHNALRRVQMTMQDHKNHSDFSQFQPEVTRLCEDDASVLDAMLEARANGHEVGPLPPHSAQRAYKLRQALDLLKKHSDEVPPSDLTDRTLAKIQHMKQQERFARQVDMLRQPRGFSGQSLRTVASVAVLALLGVSVLLPSLTRMQHEAQRIACASNVQQIGVALGQYAADHGGEMPRAAAAAGWSGSLSQGLDKSVSDTVRKLKAKAPQQDTSSQKADAFQLGSSAASLFHLIRSGYANEADVRCPSYGATPQTFADHATDFGGPGKTPFAFQAQPVQGVIILEHDPRRVVLADRNPLACNTSGRVEPENKQNLEVPSHSHPIVGQNTLFADGNVQWTVRPITVRQAGQRLQPVEDNIWVPQDVPVTVLSVQENDQKHQTKFDVFLTQ